jgi:hypothetical protein
MQIWDTRWNSWLRHCATSWKVAGLIPDGVIGIFYFLNPSGCQMDLGLTHPLKKNITMDILRGEQATVRNADNLTTFMRRLSKISRSLNFLEPWGLSYKCRIFEEMLTES